MHEVFGMVVFDSTHAAMACEELFKTQKIKSRLLTTPGEISAGCGLSVHFDLDALPLAETLLKGNEIDYRDVFIVKKNGVSFEYKKLELRK